MSTEGTQTEETPLEIEEATRKPFNVLSVKLTLQNVDQAAKWCNGKVGEESYKMLGTWTKLPCLKVPGTGSNKGQMVTALLGQYIVKHNGSFRIYRADQYKATFDPKPTALRIFFAIGDRVTCKHEDGNKVGEVVGFENGMIIVDVDGSNEQCAHLASFLEHVSQTEFNKGDWVQVINKASDRYNQVGQVYALAESVSPGVEDGLIGVDFGTDHLAPENSVAPFYETELKHYDNSKCQ